MTNENGARGRSLLVTSQRRQIGPLRRACKSLRRSTPDLLESRRRDLPAAIPPDLEEPRSSKSEGSGTENRRGPGQKMGGLRRTKWEGSGAHICTQSICCDTQLSIFENKLPSLSSYSFFLVLSRSFFFSFWFFVFLVGALAFICSSPSFQVSGFRFSFGCT